MQPDLFGEKREDNRKRRPRRMDPVYDRIVSCEACDLIDTNPYGPVPFSGKCPARVAVVGTHPSGQDLVRGSPFNGSAGHLLHAELKSNGVNPAAIFYTNVVCCGTGDQKPKVKQLEACSGNLWAQLRHSQCEWVLLLGAIALNTLFPWGLVKDRRRGMSEMRGRIWWYEDMKWFPAIHPAAALRQKIYMDPFIQDIRNFVRMVRSGPEWYEECFGCGAEVDYYTEHGIAWCKACIPGFARDQIPTYTVT